MSWRCTTRSEQNKRASLGKTEVGSRECRCVSHFQSCSSNPALVRPAGRAGVSPEPHRSTSDSNQRYHYSVICHLRPPRRRVSLADVIEQRWAGDNRSAGNSWSHDHGCGRGDCTATAGRTASGRTFRFGSRSVCALVVAGWQRAMEGPLGAGDLKRIGAPRVD